MDEFEDAFVKASPFDRNERRAEIWSHWDRARRVLANLVPVYAAWISGSFVTTKLEPDDMDIVFVIDGKSAETLAVEQPGRAQMVTTFAMGRHFHQMAGRRLDSYLVHWKCIPDQESGENDPNRYYYIRGMWDDFWQRRRTSGKGTPATPADAVPQHGYLEVKLGEYIV